MEPLPRTLYPKPPSRVRGFLDGFGELTSGRTQGLPWGSPRSTPDSVSWPLPTSNFVYIVAEATHFHAPMSFYSGNLHSMETYFRGSPLEFGPSTLETRHSRVPNHLYRYLATIP